jgi:hypothetical protein
MHASVNRRRVVSMGVLEGLLIGLVGCGDPPVGSGGSGSGTTGDGDAMDSDADDTARDPEESSETHASGGRGSGYPGGAGDDASESSSDDGAPPNDPPQTPPATDDCACAPDAAFRYAWIANPADDTVSKLDVDSMQIVGRFFTRAPIEIPAGGAPSVVGDETGPVATSVSIDGRAAAIANHDGGVVKIHARIEDCTDPLNTIAGVQTSQDSTALPWGTDECVAWSVPFDFTTQTTVAWGPGDVDPVTCEHVDQVVWTAGCNADEDLLSSVVRIDGDSGMVLDEIGLSAFPCATAVPTMGAVDRDGAFWFAANDPGSPRLGRLSAEGVLDLVEVPPIVPSGIAIDHETRVWISSRGASGFATAARYIPGTAQWDLADNVLASGRSGIVADEEGRMWVVYSGYAGLPVAGGTFVVGDTMQVDAPNVGVCPSGSCGTIALDFAGRVWTTSATGERVHRYDPMDASVSMSSGIDVSGHGSDITGWALHNAVCGG